LAARFDVERLFKTIDQMDAEEFASFFTENGTFRFGNAEPVAGRKAIQEAVGGFFASIAGLHHQGNQTWDAADDIAVTEGLVIYTRHDGGTVDVPFVNVYRLEDGLIRDYRIYVDITPLYAG
jgi:ketosteroid isomerase-like protein